jgi:sugar/nucleoside kinase (ribokinase family)
LDLARKTVSWAAEVFSSAREAIATWTLFTRGDDPEVIETAAQIAKIDRAQTALDLSSSNAA